MKTKYACTADVGTGARCRIFVDWPLAFCPDHFEQVRQGKEPSPAPVPDVVRICLTLLPQWSRGLQSLGLVRGQAKDRVEQVRQIEVHAQRFGHEAYAYRKDFPDSGTLVFYTSEPGIPEAESMKKGIKNISVWEVFKEFLKTYSLGRVFIEPRQGKLDRLIIPFYRETAESIPQDVSFQAVERLLEQFIHSWNVHVYVNPPRGDGKIVHTLNAHGRKEKASYELRFNHGLWAVEEAVT